MAIEDKGISLTVPEVASYLHVHPSTIYRMVKRHELPAFRVGADWRFNLESIKAWCKEREINGATAGPGKHSGSHD
jgi:excisionase family DNA binding protein